MKELEDFNWFPAFLRNFQTDYIGFVVAKFNIYNVFVDYLNEHPLKTKKMFDLCAGSGEPAISIFKKTNNFQELILSDKFPRTDFTNQTNIMYADESIDVHTISFEEDVTYTLFNAFHHFADEVKIEMLEKCKAAKSNLFIVEILEPSLLFYLKVLVLTTFGVLLFNPFVKPFSWKRLIFTYILPINLLTITIDGMISVYKSRRLKKYQTLFSKLTNVKVFNLKRGISSLVVIELTNSHK